MARNILVIGAAGGVGLEVTRKLITQGDRVVGTVRNETEAALLADLRDGMADLLEIDLGDADAVLERLTRHCDDAPDYDSVIICAAINPSGPMETENLSVVRRTFEVNTLSVLAIYQALMPSLRRTRGTFIMIGSITGKFAMPFIGTYTISKFGLEGLADVIRREAYPWGVRVVLMQPGGINTPMSRAHVPEITERMKDLSQEEIELYGPLYNGFVDRLKVTVPNGSPPALVADAILDALDQAEPAARYPVGPDAVALAEKLQSMTDLDIDDMLRESYSGALKRRV